MSEVDHGLASQLAVCSHCEHEALGSSPDWGPDKVEKKCQVEITTMKTSHQKCDRFVQKF